MKHNDQITKNSKWTLLPVVISLAWPTMLEQLMQTAVQYIDMAMVGSIGTLATAAVGATTTLNWLINGTVAALGVGFLAYIAQSIGAGDRERAIKAVTQSVFTVLIAGTFFTVACLVLSPIIPVWMQVDENVRPLASAYFFILYVPMLPRAANIIFGTILRAAGDTRTPMRVGMLVNVINVVLNYLLIYPSREIQLAGLSFMMPGAGWGVEGAAIASAVSLAAGGVYMTVALWKHPNISPRGQEIKPDMQVLRVCMKVAIPNMMQRFATSLGYVFFSAMINSLGELSTAAHTIANTVESAFYIPGYGMQTAAATLIGNAYGAKDRKRMKDLSVVMLVTEVVLMLVSGSLLFAFAKPMVGLFTDDAQVIMLGATVLRMIAFVEPFYGVTIIIEGMMQGVGNTVTPFVYNIIGMWGIRIVGTFIWLQLPGFSLISAWTCMIIHLMFVFGLFMINRLKSVKKDTVF